MLFEVIVSIRKIGEEKKDDDKKKEREREIERGQWNFLDI